MIAPGSARSCSGAGLLRFSTEWARRGEGADDDILDYSLEWAFFTRTQWGEYDTALYELERCWGEGRRTAPLPIGAAGRPPTERIIRSLDDVHAAVAHYVGAMPADRLLSMATHVSTDIDYSLPADDEMAAALSRRDRAHRGPSATSTAAYINEAFLARLARVHGDRDRLSSSASGPSRCPSRPAAVSSQRTIAQLAAIISRHPRLRFQCFLASRPRQPVAVHPGPRTPEPVARRLLVATTSSPAPSAR